MVADGGTVTTHPEHEVQVQSERDSVLLAWRARPARADILRHALTHSNYHVYNGGRSPSFRNISDWPAIDRCSRRIPRKRGIFGGLCLCGSVYRRICSSVISIVILFECQRVFEHHETTRENERERGGECACVKERESVRGRRRHPSMRNGAAKKER